MRSNRTGRHFDAAFGDDEDIPTRVEGSFLSGQHQLVKAVLLGIIGSSTLILQVCESDSALATNQEKGFEVRIDPSVSPNRSPRKEMWLVAQIAQGD